MKILEICPFSAGICGVWTRVLSESKEFVKLGYGVIVFSSNIEKGTGNIVSCEDEIEKIKIKRFHSKTGLIDKILSKNVTYFNFENDLRRLKPDLVITHLLHPHSFKALKICKELSIPCYLVTHAPFNVKRGLLLDIATKFYNFIKVKTKINQFTKVIAVTKWEVPYLLKLGVRKDKITYIPNGIPDEFFKQKKSGPIKGRDVLFLGRIAPIKGLETLILAAKQLPDINFSIVGTHEEDYLIKIKKLIKSENIMNVKFYPPIYDLNDKIRLIDQHKIFVLSSVREAMPQVILEAMSRGKLIISSATDGGKELINHKKNGFLFRIGNYDMLAKIIKENINGNKNIQKNAIQTSRKYSWSFLIKKYIKLFNEK